MKISKTFRLSEEAVKVLDSKENATKYLEDVLLSPPEAVGPYGFGLEDIEDMVRAILEEFKLDLKQPAQSSTFIPQPPDPETGYPCCNKQSPCKHWMWSGTDSVWKNTLTGKVREP